MEQLKMTKRISRLFIPLILMVWASTAFALDSISFTAGAVGRPSSVKLFRLGGQWDWNKQWFKNGDWFLGGYFDASAAYLYSNGDSDGDNRSIGVFSFEPMFRYQRLSREAYSFNPFIEGGVGPALITSTRFADKSLSTAYQFDDRIGAGARFGEKQQYEIAFHYQHYSNASIKRPNQGIDIKLVGTFKYYFS